MSTSKINELDSVFYPKSIAVAGVSSNTSKIGFKYLQSLKDSGFKGELYAILTTRAAGSRRPPGWWA